MWKEIINANDTDQPFSCSDELIEQGVDKFKPILEKAGVFGPKSNNKYIVSQKRRRPIMGKYHNSFRNIMVEDISGRKNVFSVDRQSRKKLVTIAKLVAKINEANARKAKASKAKVKPLKQS